VEIPQPLSEWSKVGMAPYLPRARPVADLVTTGFVIVGDLSLL
jgi:hypothetical protein